MKKIIDWVLYITIFLMFWCSGSNLLLFMKYPTYGPTEAIIPPCYFFLFILFLIKGLKLSLNDSFVRNGSLFILFIGFITSLTGRNAFWGNYLSTVGAPLIFYVLLYKKGIQISQSAIQWIILSFYVLNSIVAIIERLNTFVFLPNVGFMNLFQTDNEGFRSCALTGYPLMGATFTSLVMFFLLISAIKDLYKYTLWGIGAFALLCFNSRTAIICAGVSIFFYSIKVLREKPSFSKNIILIIAIVIGYNLLEIAFREGYADRLSNFGVDGSSQVRMTNLNYLYKADFLNLLFGYSKNEMKALAINTGNVGLIIENPWLIYIFRYGLIFFTILLIYYIFLFKKMLTDYSIIDTCIILIPWLIDISSNTGFGYTVNVLISQMCVCIFAFSKNTSNSIPKIRNIT